MIEAFDVYVSRDVAHNALTFTARLGVTSGLSLEAANAMDDLDIGAGWVMEGIRKEVDRMNALPARLVSHDPDLREWFTGRGVLVAEPPEVF